MVFRILRLINDRKFNEPIKMMLEFVEMNQSELRI